MTSNSRTAPETAKVIALLSCPNCSSPVAQATNSLICENPACGVVFPIHGGIIEMVARALPLWNAGDRHAFRKAEEGYSALCRTALGDAGGQAWGDVEHATSGYRAFVRNYCHQMRGAARALHSDTACILDISGGAGAYLRALAPEFKKAIHLEAHAPSIQTASIRAREAGLRNIVFVRGSYLSPPVAGASIDVLLCTDTLIRTSTHDRLLLRAIHRCLVPSGIAIIDCHARTWSRRSRIIGPTSRYTKAEFHGLLRQTGFSILDIKPAGYLPSTLDCPSWMLNSAAALSKLLKRPARWMAIVRREGIPESP